MRFVKCGHWRTCDAACFKLYAGPLSKGGFYESKLFPSPCGRGGSGLLLESRGQVRSRSPCRNARKVVDFGLDDLDAIRGWMDKYQDREVDFADATLIWLAVARRTNLIATTDFNEFEAYRLPNRKAFNILIER